jgi:hypothetical protein
MGWFQSHQVGTLSWACTSPHTPHPSPHSLNPGARLAGDWQAFDTSRSRPDESMPQSLKEVKAIQAVDTHEVTPSSAKATR